MRCRTIRRKANTSMTLTSLPSQEWLRYKTELAAAGQITDTDESGGAQNLFGNGYVGHPCGTPSGQLT